MYEYQVSFAGGLSQTGKCGYVTHHEIGKRLTLIVNADLTGEGIATKSNALNGLFNKL